MSYDDAKRAVIDVLNDLQVSRVPGSTVQLSLADCIRNADAAGYVTLHTVTDPISSGVAGSTVVMPPRDVARNAEAHGFELLAAVQALTAKVDALTPNPAAPPALITPAGA